jgi:polar amino acid transport system substrate-binding protein
MSRSLRTLALVALTGSVLAACSSSATNTQSAAASIAASTTASAAATSCVPTGGLQTVSAGELTIAATQDMPYDGIGTDGKVTGVMGDVITEIAGKLGLTVNLQQMDFAPELEAVKTGRVDTAIDGMVYTKERAGIYNLTQKFFYIPEEITQRKATNFKTMEDLKGHTVGTIQGYGEVPQLQAVPWIGTANLKLYNGVDALVQDLLAGRLDSFIVGAPTAAWIITQHPDWDIKYNLMAPTSLLTGTATPDGAIYPANLSNKTLVPAMDCVITQMKGNGDLIAILTKYHMTDPVFVNGR